ncbi:DUF1905 domain-containing protein [Demequina lutea]|uniref:DUF1905 domain-containing protein n=1 Tax=Demequina lutea TaxID=431489 RepID=A0A7Y9Z9K3_9MICO|nr:DUF1905 domain-containing protein [Demequina lutea]NYI41106.1 hypothetical protein [Demequina lutea]
MTYTFAAELYLWAARTDCWVFANLPEDVADEIEDAAPEPRRGFGAVKVEVTVGSSTWRTSVFPSKQDATFVLPVKKAILKAESLRAGETATFILRTV